ncbi:unnamed protein product [Effrenium voratum]|uniref:C3H1-type domain-containing protein n=1 Tax=Effrenium voratum TaxID=2562239 RepID=A0AA36HSM4_9DINO|nr:unnamed protein product [Effrenium voratum]CAJ1373474.1 unnamed protein product [Effrenium voratum]CAJ1435131.1 unnamed protein product [Effrenium voratum]CAJ1435132.1 unnamed protein product [Effrenium voratum]
MEDSRALDFELVEKSTFLEYLPVRQMRRSASCHGCRDQNGSMQYLLPEAPASTSGMSLAGANLAQPGSEGTSPEGSPRSDSVRMETLSTGESTTCWEEDSQDTPFGREPEWSVGSMLHPQRCKPCAWFWRPTGCARSADCQHCHACLPGELLKRRRQNRALAKSLRKLAKESPAMPCLAYAQMGSG